MKRSAPACGLYELRYLFLLLIIVLFIPIAASSQNVWPGDCNRDGRVDNFDILAIGYAFGVSGPARPLALQGGDFDPVQVTLWPNELPVSGLNYGYIDCNGDGIIDSFDIIVVDTNYAKMQTSDTVPQIDSFLAGLTGSLTFSIDPGYYTQGDTVMVRIESTSPNYPTLEDTVVGISFSVLYEIEYTRDSTTAIHINPSWLGGGPNTIDYGIILDESMMPAAKTSGVKNEGGRIDVTIIDQLKTKKSGAGEVSVVCIIMDENLAKVLDSTDVYMNLSFTDVKMVTAEETSIAVLASADSIQFRMVDPCPKPEDPVTEALADHHAVLNWTAVPDADGYEVRGRLADIVDTVWIDSIFILAGANGTPPDDFLDVPGLPLNRQYEWQLRSICLAFPGPLIFTSPWSAVSGFSTGCGAPMHLRADQQPGVTTLSWSPVLGAKYYKVYGRTAGSNGTPVMLTTPISIGAMAPTHYDVFGLPPGSYEWGVVAVCDDALMLESALAIADVLTVDAISTDTINATKANPFEPLLVYPNPAGNYVKLDIYHGGNSSCLVELIDMNGQQLLQKTIEGSLRNSTVELDVSLVMDGMYFLRVQGSAGSSVRKLIVQR